MAFVPIMGVILAGKVAENSIDYSLQKTTEQTLFLVTSRDAKYKVKAIVDTFFVRMGDVLSALLVWVGSRIALSTQGFLVVTVLMLVGWLLLAVNLGRAHHAREVAAGEPPSPGPGACTVETPPTRSTGHVLVTPEPVPAS
jgi:AAA family ATP:ADP antiporter